MKLISNLDVNGNKFINGELTLQMPAVTGTKTIATHEEVQDVIAQFGGAFQFKGEAIRIKADTDPANSTIIIAGETQGSEVEIVAAAANRGNVYQIGDKEYASNGTVWVELGFNIDLTPYLTIASAAETYETKANVALLDGRVGTLETAVGTTIPATYATKDALAEAEEVTSAALNDLNSRVGGLDSDIVTINTAVEGLDDRLTAAEGDIDSLEAAIEGLSGDAVKSVAFGSNTAIEPDEDGKVTLTAATDSADGYMTSTDHTKLTGIATGAQVNVIEGVKLDGAADVLPLTSKVATIPNASANGNGLMTSSDFSKLSGIEANAQVNVQADWAETDNTSDAYIANKPTNLAATYVYEPTEAQYIAKTVTISATAHKCGLWPLVQVYYGMDVVSANVSVVVNNQNHDVTVSWEVAADSTHPIHIRIVG